MCFWLILGLLTLVCVVAYCHWILWQDVDYYKQRCDELDAQLKHVSDMETMELLDKKTKKPKDSGIVVDFDRA